MNNDFSHNDIVEIIFMRNNEIIHKIFKNVETAENILKKYSSDIRLDLHGVTDITKPDTELIQKDKRKSHTISIISYVGKTSETRMLARQEVKNRIKTGQIDFGVLIFKRCKRDQSGKNTYHECGSKAWVNNFIQTQTKAIFIDDSEDHVNSVKSMNIDNLNSILFTGKTESELLKLIEFELDNIKGGYYNKYVKYKRKYLVLSENKKN